MEPRGCLDYNKDTGTGHNGALNLSVRLTVRSGSLNAQLSMAAAAAEASEVNFYWALLVKGANLIHEMADIYRK